MSYLQLLPTSFAFVIRDQTFYCNEYILYILCTVYSHKSVTVECYQYYRRRWKGQNRKPERNPEN